MKLLRCVSVAAALAMCAVPQAAADLPKEGKYKGTLTVTRWIGGNDLGAGSPTVKNTYKVMAIVNADGAVGIMFGGELAPIFGKLRADNLGVAYIDLELTSMQVETCLLYTSQSPRD